MNDSAILERFGRQLLVRGWSLRSQEQLASLRIGLSRGLHEAFEYLRAAGAERLSWLDDSTPVQAVNVAILEQTTAPVGLILEAPLALQITLDETGVSWPNVSGQQQRTLRVPANPASWEIAQTTACAVLLGQLMAPSSAATKN